MMFLGILFLLIPFATSQTNPTVPEMGQLLSAQPVLAAAGVSAQVRAVIAAALIQLPAAMPGMPCLQAKGCWGGGMVDGDGQIKSTFRTYTLASGVIRRYFQLKFILCSNCDNYAALLVIVNIGVFVLFLLALWVLARGVFGVMRLKAGRPIDNPRTWLF